MAIYFLDSSAVIKNYLRETGSIWLRALVNAMPRHELYVSRLAHVEVVATLIRQSRGGRLTSADAATLISQFKTHLGTDFQVLEITTALVSEAVSVTEKHGLRGYDAMQLAAALAIRNQMTALGLAALNYTFVAADNELNKAAHAEGLNVENPNLYP